MRSAVRLAELLAFLLLLLAPLPGGAAGGSAAPVADDGWPDTEPRIDARCTAEMVKARFSSKKPLRLLLLRFHGGSPKELDCGHQLARGYSKAVGDFIEALRPLPDLKAHAAALRQMQDQLETHYVPCRVETDEQARLVARAWGAQLVIWGRADKGGPKPAAPVGGKSVPGVAAAAGPAPGGHAGIGVQQNNSGQAHGTIVMAGGQQTIIHQTPNPDACEGVVLTPHVTDVEDERLQTAARGGLDAGRVSFAQSDFPQLLPDRAHALFFYTLGKLAFDQGRNPLALALLDRTLVSQVLEAAEQGWRLPMLVGFSLTQMGRVEEGERRIREALAGCAEADLLCRGQGHLLLGGSQLFHGHPAAAIESLTQALSLARQLDRPTSERTLLENLGAAHAVLGRLSEAQQYIEQARQQEGRGGGPLSAHALNTLGLIHLWKEELPQALEQFRKVREAQRLEHKVQGEALALANEGEMLTKLGRYDEARRQLEAALQRSTELKDPAGQAHAILNLASLLANAEQYKAALAKSQEARQRAQAAHRPDQEGQALRLIGALQAQLGQERAAEASFRQALKLLEASGHTLGRVWALEGLADLHEKQGQVATAIAEREEALRHLRPSGAYKRLHPLCSKLGALLFQKKDFSAAKERFTEALGYAVKTGDPAWIANEHKNLGLVHRDLNQWDEAARHLRTAAEHYAQAKDPEDRARTLSTLSNVLAGVGDQTGALEAIEAACSALAGVAGSERLLLQTQASHGMRLFMARREAEGLAKLKPVLAELVKRPGTEEVQGGIELALAGFYGEERPAEALPYLRAAEAHFAQAKKPAEQLQAGAGIADALKLLGQVDAALAQYKAVLPQAERAGSTAVQTELWMSLGFLHATGKLDFRAAAEAYRRAAALTRDELTRITILKSWAEAERQGKRFKEALAVLREVADAVDAYLPRVTEPVQRQELRGTRHAALDFAYHLALQLNQPALARQLNARIEAAAVEEARSDSAAPAPGGRVSP